MHVAVLLPLLVRLAAAFVVPTALDATELAPASFDLLSSASTSSLVRKDELYNNRVLLIRHGEFFALLTPSGLADPFSPAGEKRRHGQEGLSKAGRKRAQCLRRVLGRHNSVSSKTQLSMFSSRRLTGLNAAQAQRRAHHRSVLQRRHGQASSAILHGPPSRQGPRARGTHGLVRLVSAPLKSAELTLLR
jgi:hypothetical protein